MSGSSVEVRCGAQDEIPKPGTRLCAVRLLSVLWHRAPSLSNRRGLYLCGKASTLALPS